MREGVNVKGLTTAASLWATACLGVAAGGGYYEVALIGMVLMFITLTLLEVIQNLLLKGTRRHNLDYIVVCTDVSTAMNAINQTADLCSCKITDIRIENKAESNAITFHAAFGTGGLKRRQQRFLDVMVGAEGVLSIEPVKEAVNV